MAWCTPERAARVHSSQTSQLCSLAMAEDTSKQCCHTAAVLALPAIYTRLLATRAEATQACCITSPQHVSGAEKCSAGQCSAHLLLPVLHHASFKTCQHAATAAHMSAAKQQQSSLQQSKMAMKGHATCTSMPCSKPSPVLGKSTQHNIASRSAINTGAPFQQRSILQRDFIKCGAVQHDVRLVRVCCKARCTHTGTRSQASQTVINIDMYMFCIVTPALPASLHTQRMAMLPLLFLSVHSPQCAARVRDKQLLHTGYCRDVLSWRKDVGLIRTSQG